MIDNDDQIFQKELGSYIEFAQQLREQKTDEEIKKDIGIRGVDYMMGYLAQESDRHHRIANSIRQRNYYEQSNQPTI